MANDQQQAAEELQEHQPSAEDMGQSSEEQSRQSPNVAQPNAEQPAPTTATTSLTSPSATNPMTGELDGYFKIRKIANRKSRVMRTTAADYEVTFNRLATVSDKLPQLLDRILFLIRQLTSSNAAAPAPRHAASSSSSSQTVHITEEPQEQRSHDGTSGDVDEQQYHQQIRCVLNSLSSWRRI